MVLGGTPNVTSEIRMVHKERNGKHKTYADGVNWKSWKGYQESLKTTAMMFRKNPGMTTSEYEH